MDDNEKSPSAGTAEGKRSEDPLREDFKPHGSNPYKPGVDSEKECVSDAALASGINGMAASTSHRGKRPPLSPCPRAKPN